MSFASRLSYPKRSEFDSMIYGDKVDFNCRVVDMETQGMYSNPVSYYDFLQNRVMVHFKPKDEDSEKAAEFNLTLSKKMTYDMVGIHFFQLYVTIVLTRRLEIDVAKGRRVPASRPLQVTLHDYPTHRCSQDSPQALPQPGGF
jgi:hypothetical protein